MDWHFTKTDLDSVTKDDPTRHTVQSHGKLTHLQIFVREILQNSLDNRAGNPAVNVDFRIKYLKDQKKTEFMESLKYESVVPHIKVVRESEISENRPTTFIDPEEILRENYTLKLLYIEDYGTRGLVGAEHEGEKNLFQKPHCFLGLCRNIGDSQKGNETLGGTYGYGKTVLWKNSRLGLVMFYSRLCDPYTKAGEPQEHSIRSFGQIRLAGHNLDDQPYKGEGFFGKREVDITHSVFDSDAEQLALDLGMRKRESDEYGTSILIVDFDDPDIDDEVEDDQETATRINEASEFFYWPAIVDEDLIVRSRTEDWSEDKWLKADPSASSELIPFIKAYKVARNSEPQKDIELQTHSVKVPKGPRGEDEVSGMFSVSTYLKESEDDSSRHLYLNKTALIRGAGMVVGYKGYPRSGLGGKDYYAVVVAGNACPNPEPDSLKAQNRCEQLVGWSEPVTHDTWTENSDHLKQWFRARARIKEVITKIRKSISDVTTEHTKPEGLAAPLLASLFPLVQGTETEKEKRDINIEITKPPGLLNEELNDNLQNSFEIKVIVPAKRDFHSDDKPSRWRVTCLYGFYGEGRGRKIIAHSLLKFTGVKKNGQRWESIESDFKKESSYEGLVNNQKLIYELRGITDKLDPFLSQMTKHELEVYISTIDDEEVAE